MSRRQLPRTTAAILDAATFLPGEIAVDTTNDELRYDGDGSTVGGIVVAKKSAVTALDATKAGLADSNVFTGALNTFKRIFISAADAVYNLSSNVLATLAYFSSGGTITVAASKQLDVLHWTQTVTADNGAIVHFGNANITVSAASHSGANARGWVANLINLGAAAVKAIYGRAEGQGASTGALASHTGQIVPGASTSVAYGLQIAGDSTARKIDYAYQFQAVSGSVAIDYGFLLADGVAVAQAGFQMFADGAGPIWLLKNAAGSADLAYTSAGGGLVAQTGNFAGNVTISGNLEISHASANTLSGSGGDLFVEGNLLYRAGGTDVALADGGTGASSARGACANLAGVHILAQSGASSAHTGNTTETTLATITVPANAMGANGRLRVEGVIQFSTTTASGKTLRIKFGGQTFYSATATGTTVSLRFAVWIWNANATGSQVAGANDQAGFGGSTTAVTTTSIDTTASQDVTITGQLVDGSDTITLRARTVELLYAA